MPNDYESRMHDLCAAAGVPDLAPQMVAGGVAANTLATAIRAAQATGASDLRTAIREHEGVAAQMAHTGSGAATSHHGWQAAFERQSAKAGTDTELTAASHVDSWAAAFARAQHG